MQVKQLLPPPLRRTIGNTLRRLKGPQPRRYIPAGMSVADFFAALHAARASYVVLRWFETLPDVEPGEDIDMLVADADLPILAPLLNPVAGGTPCDIYTVNGLKGTQYKGMAYFPAALAEKTISRRQTYKQVFEVPSPEDHFMGLAYHAVYQKGPASGLPTRYSDVDPTSRPEHDYAGHLRRLADSLGLDVAIDMESLDEVLASKGYRPEPAMRAALMQVNPWIAHHLSAG